MDRRDLLKGLAILGATAVVKSYGACDVLAQTISSDQTSADLVAVMGGEPADMLEKALAELGGLGRYVQKGQKVVIKPNIGWDLKPELGANTNPELVAALVKGCLAVGAAEVLVFDHTCDEWSSCYKKSGVEEAAKAAGAKVMPAHEESYYRAVSLPNGKTLKEAKIHQAVLDCDVWINAPVLKHHGGANLSIAMKNYMGLVWDRRKFHSSGLHQCIADVCTFEKRPVLNVVDAYRVVKTNGPRTNSESDVVTPKALFASADIVAVDTAAAKFFSQIRDMPLEYLNYLADGQALGLGTTDLNKLNIKRIKM